MQLTIKVPTITQVNQSGGSGQGGTPNTYTTSSNTQVSVDAFPVVSYRSAKYNVQMTSGSEYHLIELTAMHDGANVWLSQYGEIYSKEILGTFDANIVGTSLNLLFTGVYPVTTIKLLRNALPV